MPFGTVRWGTLSNKQKPNDPFYSALQVAADGVFHMHSNMLLSETANDMIFHSKQACNSFSVCVRARVRERMCACMFMRVWLGREVHLYVGVGGEEVSGVPPSLARHHGAKLVAEASLSRKRLVEASCDSVRLFSYPHTRAKGKPSH